MSHSSAVVESLKPEPPRRGISQAKAHLLAEGSHWIATGEAYHDESQPMGKILARLDELVPSEEFYACITTPKEELGGYALIDYIDADQLDPIEALLDRMEERSDSPTGPVDGRT